MNAFLPSTLDFFQSLQATELGLGLLSLLLIIALLACVSRVLSLKEKNEEMQKDYAPRRKRVYQEYINWLTDAYSDGIMDLTPERQESLRALHLDIALWSSDTIVTGFRQLQLLLVSDKEVTPERIEKLLFTALIDMRTDLGFRSKGITWGRLRDLVLLPQ